MGTAHGLSDAEASSLLIRLMRIVPRLVASRGDHEDVDEVASEVILRVQGALIAGSSEMRAHLSDNAYLGGVARNVCRERERCRGVDRRGHEHVASLAARGGVDTCASDATRSASRNEQARSLQAAIGRLTPGQRAAALLRAAGHRPADIERILGRSRWSVRSALESLRRGLTSRVRAAEAELPRPTEPLTPGGFFGGRRRVWERPWALHLAGANHTDIAQALKISTAAAGERIKRIRRAIREAVERARRASRRD